MKCKMNRKKIVSLLLTLGILATPVVAPQYTDAGNLNNKVYAYDDTIRDGNKAQKAPLQTATGQVGEGITTPARMAENMTYEEAMSSPYKVEATYDETGHLKDGSGSNNSGNNTGSTNSATLLHLDLQEKTALRHLLL
ncbi:hypothetical protein LN736_13880 [Clostridium sp. WLY-B-L2]|uniref:Uncharacterized protein n=1 Tax=Clostridium aromativorans TaxID=2836848 RepID=A0ABS8N8H5_9CLOT|nr:hypothetical protein [Clostridium aromativorans]MCC9295951.1 hypothetical protein [Clostridium aromativorans]